MSAIDSRLLDYSNWIRRGHREFDKGILCQREAELTPCSALESRLDLRPGSNFAFAKRPVSMLIRFRIENANSGSNLGKLLRV